MYFYFFLFRSASIGSLGSIRFIAIGVFLLLSRGLFLPFQFLFFIYLLVLDSLTQIPLAGEPEPLIQRLHPGLRYFHPHFTLTLILVHHGLRCQAAERHLCEGFGAARSPILRPIPGKGDLATQAGLWNAPIRRFF